MTLCDENFKADICKVSGLKCLAADNRKFVREKTTLVNIDILFVSVFADGRSPPSSQNANLNGLGRKLRIAHEFSATSSGLARVSLLARKNNVVSS